MNDCRINTPSTVQRSAFPRVNPPKPLEDGNRHSKPLENGNRHLIALTKIKEEVGGFEPSTAEDISITNRIKITAEKIRSDLEKLQDDKNFEQRLSLAFEELMFLSSQLRDHNPPSSCPKVPIFKSGSNGDDRRSSNSSAQIRDRQPLRSLGKNAPFEKEMSSYVKAAMVNPLTIA